MRQLHVYVLRPEGVNVDAIVALARHHAAAGLHRHRRVAVVALRRIAWRAAPPRPWDRDLGAQGEIQGCTST